MRKCILYILRAGIVCLISMSFAGNLFSQAPMIERLEESLRAASSEEIRVDLMNELAREYIYISATTASRYANEALQKSRQIKYKKGEAYAYRNLSSGFSAQELYLPATEFIEKSIALFEESGDSVGMANCYLTLANTYRRQSDYRQAVSFNKRAVSIFRSAQNDERLGVGLHNLAETEMLNLEYRSSAVHIDEALTLAQKLRNHPVLTSCFLVKAKIAFKQDQIDKAETLCEEALKISGQLGLYAQKHATTESYIYLGRIAGMKKNFLAEEKYLTQAITLALSNQYIRLLDEAYLQLTGHYLRLKNYTAASKCLASYKAFNDSISIIQNRDKAAMLKPVLNSIKISAKNESLEAQQKLQERLIELQQLKLYAYLSAMILMLIVTVLVMRLYQQRKKVAAKLQVKNNIIEEKTQRLEEANHTKDKFFSIVSHDLKSPLDTLYHFIILLEGYSEKLTPVEIKRLTSDIKLNLSNTMTLTDNLVKWANSQMGINKTELTPLDLQSLVCGVIALYAENAERKRITITYSGCDNAIISGDPDQLQFVARNLINNAIKFTPSGGAVSVTVRDIGEKYVLTVTDTGLGIPERMLSTLFLPGKWRSTRGTSGERGTGLGLVLAKEFIEQNNAIIQVDSTVGKGSTFRMFFKKLGPDPDLS